MGFGEALLRVSSIEKHVVLRFHFIALATFSAG